MTKYAQGELMYKRGLSAEQVSKHLGISRILFGRYLRSKGIPKHTTRYYTPRKCGVDTDVFRIINTEVKAYWLGFIYADGCLSDNNTFELSLQLSDADHLEKLRVFMKLGNTVKKDSFRCRLHIRDKVFADNLRLQGIVPRKSLILRYPDIDPMFDRPFMLGYFDGDGSLSYHQKKRTLQFSLLGTPEFLGEYIKRLNTDALLTMHQDKRHKEQTKYIVASGKYATEIYDQLIQGAGVYLERKYKVFSAVLESNFRDYKQTKTVKAEIANTVLNSEDNTTESV